MLIYTFKYYNMGSIGGVYMTDTEHPLLYKVQFYSYFVARAFLIAVFGLLLILAILLVVYFGDLFLNVKTGNYNTPLFNGYVIVSPSMVPTINIKDAIVIKRINDDRYNVGDIISFYSTEYDEEGMIITHRVIRKNTVATNLSNYTTKGDNNINPDPKSVSTSSIYGKVFLIIPKLGYIQNYLSDPLHFAVCIIIPSLVVIIYDILRISKAFKKERRFH